MSIISGQPVVLGHTHALWSVMRYLQPWLQRLFPQGIKVLQDPPATTHLDYMLYTSFGSQPTVRAPKTRYILVCCEPHSLKDKTVPHAAIHCTAEPSQFPRGGVLYHVPFAALSMLARCQNQASQLLTPRPPELLLNRPKFCAFMYSQDHLFRNQLFRDVSKYRSVDALGKCCHPNPQTQFDRQVWIQGQQTWMDVAVRKYRPYRFVICCENSQFKGYVTEKVVNAYLAGAIPIYLGAPDIAQYFNPASMIHVGDYKTPEALCARIKSLDQDPAAYEAMWKQPLFLGEGLPQWICPVEVEKRLRQAFGVTPLSTSLTPLTPLTRVTSMPPGESK